MLGIVKDLCNITDNSKDNIIQFYIDKFTSDCISYCRLEILPKSLDFFVIDKVKTIILAGSSGNIKAVSRGDTKIDYNTSTTVYNSMTFTEDEYKYLEQFKDKRVKFI